MYHYFLYNDVYTNMYYILTCSSTELVNGFFLNISSLALAGEEEAMVVATVRPTNCVNAFRRETSPLVA